MYAGDPGPPVASPTIQTCVASSAETPSKFFAWPLTTVVQFVPSVVRRIVPLSPTAHPVVASEKSTDFRLLVVGELCEVHVTPASVLTKMPPLSETAYAFVCDTQSMSRMLRLGRAFTSPDLPHVAPPSLEVRNEPFMPAASALVVLTASTAFNSLVTSLS